jgi:TrmH family RNA methyltransferase
LSNFGFTDLVLVQPYDASWREAKSAMGGKGLLAKARVLETVQEALADCSLVVGTASVGNRLLKLPVRRLEYGARVIRKAAGQAALLFGSEKTGLSNYDLSLCHWLLRIPTRNENESMNLGQAVGICAYELTRDAKAVTAKPLEARAISAAELDRIEERLYGILEASGYTQPKTAGTTRLKLRRLLRRMELRESDADLWLGMLRQIAWKIGI